MPQCRATFDDPVGMVEELHRVDADDSSAGPLFCLPQWGRLRRRQRVDASFAARHQQVEHRVANRSPGGDGGSRSVLDVVGVSGDHQAALPVRRHRQQLAVRHGPILPYRDGAIEVSNVGSPRP